MRNKYYRYIIYGMTGFAFLLFLLVSHKLRAAMVITIFIILNMALSSYKRFIRLPIEIELLTLGIVFCTLNYGIKAGLVVAILGGILSFVVGFNISPFSFPMLTGYVMMVFISYLLRNLNMTFVGLIATLANNLLVFVLYHYVFKYDLMKNISFSVSNILFNAIIFFNVLPYLSTIV